MTKTVLLTGAAGFIGSHLIDKLLAMDYQIIGIDNLSRGLKTNLATSLDNNRFIFYELDLADFVAYQKCIESAESKFGKIDTVWHMAANSDIAAGVADADIDLKDTFMSTHNTIKIMQKFKIPAIAFASSSAVYGVHDEPIREDSGPLLPISNYGAMKLASEAAISAAAESFLKSAYIFRFPNVIGSRATHGVIYDLMHKLAKNLNELEVLGNGHQQKPYLHVSELIDAMLFIWQNGQEKVNYYNIGANDDGVKVSDIASMVVAKVAPEVKINYTGGECGWIGDVPKFTYSLTKLARLGWSPKLTSLQAMEKAIAEIAQEIFKA